GNNTITDSRVPVAVQSGAASGRTIVAVAAGGYHSLALASDGSAYAWGENGQGQLGDGLIGSSNNAHVPVGVTTAATPLAGKAIVGIFADEFSSVALASDGTAYAWGEGGSGALGNGALANVDLA